MWPAVANGTFRQLQQSTQVNSTETAVAYIQLSMASALMFFLKRFSEELSGQGGKQAESDYGQQRSSIDIDQSWFKENFGLW